MEETKKKNNGLAGLLLLLGWLFFALFAVIFYFYFMDNLPFLNKKETVKEETDSSVSENAELTADITTLITNYYSAYAACDQSRLQSMVTNPDLFNDMTSCIEQSALINGYYNVNCTVYPGATEDATLVFAVSNLMIPNVNSTPLDIRSFYVRKTDSGYLIDNTAFDETVNNYIASITSSKEVQALYENVSENINQCIANDNTFAEYYNNLHTVE